MEARVIFLFCCSDAPWSRDGKRKKDWGLHRSAHASLMFQNARVHTKGDAMDDDDDDDDDASDDSRR